MKNRGYACLLYTSESMELHEYILTRNDCCRRGTPLVPRGVMVHSTGANNPYLRRYVQPDDGELGKNRYDNDWNRPGLPVCVHAFLGKKADEMCIRDRSQILLRRLSVLSGQAAGPAGQAGSFHK